MREQHAAPRARPTRPWTPLLLAVLAAAPVALVVWLVAGSGIWRHSGFWLATLVVGALALAPTGVLVLLRRRA